MEACSANLDSAIADVEEYLEKGERRRLAQRVPPLVVDTPLGRLDQEVRQAVLEKIYLKRHQSIILATNSEIDPEGPLFDLMKDSCARVYTLEPRGQPDSPHYKVCLEKDTYFGQSI